MSIANFPIASSPIASEQLVYTDFILPTSILSEESFGNLTVTSFATIQPNSIPSEEIFGNLTITLYMLPNTITSEEIFGNLTITLLATIQLGSILSEESFGNLTVTTIQPNSIPSEEIFGNLTITLYMLPNTITSEEVFGNSTVILYILPNTIPSEEIFGNLIISAASGSIQPTGIPSEEIIGNLIISLNKIVPNTITSEEDIGTLAIFIGQIPFEFHGNILHITIDSPDDIRNVVWSTSTNACGASIFRSFKGLEGTLVANSTGFVQIIAQGFINDIYGIIDKVGVYVNQFDGDLTIPYSSSVDLRIRSEWLAIPDISGEITQLSNRVNFRLSDIDTYHDVDWIPSNPSLIAVQKGFPLDNNNIINAVALVEGADGSASIDVQGLDMSETPQTLATINFQVYQENNSLASIRVGDNGIFIIRIRKSICSVII